MNVKRFWKSAELNLKKAAPDILLATGLAMSAVAIIEFCKQSFEAKPVIDEFKSKMDAINYREARKNEMVAPQAREAVLIEAKKAGAGLAKAYWKPILLWTGSTVLIIKSHTILKDRNVALTALATGLGAELRTLHQRIIDRYGEQADYELKHGITHEVVEETRTDEATGSEVVEQKDIPVVRVGEDGNGTSIYARFFDESSRCWQKNPEYNLTLLKRVEHDANQRLRSEGVLFLNDVYDMLDIPRTKAGQKVGWRYFKNPEDNIYGDNYVSLGIHNVNRAGNRDFVNGYQPVVLLDFNVDGAVIDALPMM